MARSLQILDDALRHYPHVIFAGDFLIGRRAQDAGGFLPGRVQQHHPGLALDQFLQIVPWIGDQNGAQYGELERVLHIGDSLSNRLYEVVVTSNLRGDYAELMPLVPLQDAQHRRGLMFQRRRQLQLQAALRCPLQTNGILVMFRGPCRRGERASGPSGVFSGEGKPRITILYYDENALLFRGE